MTKEYAIKDILSAVNSILKTTRKMDKLSENKKDTKRMIFYLLNKQAKPSKSDILVLNQMIE